jgi:tetratricopeptide (TPR) repeat protein
MPEYLQAFIRGQQLYASNRLAEADADFATVVTNAQAGFNGTILSSAERARGEIQRKLGHPDSAIQHFTRALEIVKTNQNAADPTWSIRTQLEVLDSIEEIYDQQGKMGLQSLIHAQRWTLLDEFAAGRGGRPSLEQFPWWWNHFWEQKVDDGLRLRRLGRLDESEAVLKEVVAGILPVAQDEKHINSAPTGKPEPFRKYAIEDLSQAYDWLSGVAKMRERLDDAVAYSEKAYDLRGKMKEFAGSYRLADMIAKRDGATPRAWDLLNTALNYVPEDSISDYWIQARLVKAELLMADGKRGEATNLLAHLIVASRKTDSPRALAPALRLRSQVYLDAGAVSAADKDAKESLALYRSFGWKGREPDLYELHAQCLVRQGKYAEALQTWEDAYRLTETIKLPNRSLDMLLGIADLQLRVGDKAALLRAWERINQFVGVHPDLPEPTQLRLRLARLDQLKALGDRDNLLAAFQETQQFVKNSKLTAFQSRALGDFRMDVPAPTVLVSAAPQPAVDLQPILAATRVATGELAHARFILVNPSPTPAVGTVQLVSAGWQGDWTPTDQGWNIALKPDPVVTHTTSNLTLAPGVTMLYLEAPLTLSSTGAVNIIWRGGATAAAQWQFGAITDSREVAIVNASLAAENPFYSVVFYHELFYRGQTNTLQNLRVTASQPCRIEIVDTQANQFLAIDANGNGDFKDAGDVLYADADADGYPDFALSPEHDVACFELRVYPLEGSIPASGKIEITLWRRDGGTWIADAMDVLKIQ